MIPNIKSTEGVGNNVLKKVIHAGSESIMFSVLQETQYVYPFKSSVREIVSNCLDSVTERNNSVKILKGEIKAEDLYITKEGSEFTESGFVSDYYDLKWLSEEDKVTILYIENDTPTRDRIKFIDNGVGLGGTRLINYFSLGFSSKRLSKNQLGSFGLGAKSLLATGIDFYTVTSKYNGREYSFDVYKDHVLSAIPKFNEDGSTNPEEIFFEGEDNEYSVYYRVTEEMNGVTVECDVKRHRKMDFISSIENQLGFIPSIELLIQDANSEYTSSSKRNIAINILFSNDKLLVGDTDYYAVPQILLKPGDDSNIMISYGTINFEELEMKKYSGNVSFILNINDVDVTPSRENVIWNTKTREAVKKMFQTAQKTVTDLIEDKIKDEKTLPDYLTLLNKFKEKNSISGMSELFKVIDLSQINNTFRGFDIGKAAVQLSERDLRNDLLFTSTENTNTYGSRRFSDTSFSSNLSKDFISKLSSKNTESKLVVYVGDSKLQGLARYAANQYYVDDRHIDIVQIKEETYNHYSKKILKEGLDNFLDAAYLKRDFREVLIAEVIRFTQAPETKARVLFHPDIDLALMLSLSKEQEKKVNTRYMNYAEKQKAAGKAIGNRHYSTGSTVRVYYDERDIEENSVIMYAMGDLTAENLIHSANSIPDGYTIVGFSQENFKRFYKVEGARMLTDCLYSIEFGDISFTPLGLKFLPSSIRDQLTKLYASNNAKELFKDSSFKFLAEVFRDFKVKKSNFTGATAELEKRLKRRREDYYYSGVEK